MRSDEVLSRRLACLLAVLSAGCLCSGQLEPSRTYYGVGGPIPMTVRAPEGAGSVRVALLMPATGVEVAAADVKAGEVDLGALFPVLWDRKVEPSSDRPGGVAKPELLYAQLIVDDEQTGPAVVLQPMVTPDYCRGQRQSGELVWLRWGVSAAYSGVRAYIDRHVVFETDAGEIEFAMRPDVAPNTVWNFLELAEGGFYTGIIFHRIVPMGPGGNPFVIQVGDPTGTGTGGPGYYIDLEESPLPHDFGVLSMARSQEPNSVGSQVFICLSREATAGLDGSYTSFAQAVRGAEAIQAIASTELADAASGRPAKPPVLVRAYLKDAPPQDRKPPALTRPGRAASPPR